MTEDDLDQPATRRDLLVLRDELRRDLSALREELRRHFDITAEKFKEDFKNLFDWTQATTSTMGGRVDQIEAEPEKRRSS